MALYRVKGKAHYNGACHKSFEEIVEVNDPRFSNDYEDAVQAKHPDWEAICVFSHDRL